MNATTVTLTTASTVYNLFTLMQAIQPTITSGFNQIFLTADAANAGNVFLGDSSVTTSIFGTQMPATGSTSFGPNSFNGLSMEAIYLVADTNSQKVEVVSSKI